MKKMGLAAKLCSICAIVIIYIFITYMTKMEFFRSDNIHIYTNENNTYFYSSSNNSLYCNNQVLQICSDDGIYHDAKITSIEKHEIIIDNTNIFVYQIELLDDYACINDSTYNVRIQYNSFVKFLLTSFQNR